MPQAHHHHHTAHVATKPPPPPKPLWTVVRQELDRRYVPGTDPIEEWVVYFVTRNGTEAYVRVPRDSYTADLVAAMIQPEAEMIEAVGSMSHKD